LLRPKPSVERLVPSTHGGIDYDELQKIGIPPENIIDFSISCNPFGPPPGIREALDNTIIDRYPDSESSELKQLLATKLGIATDNLLIGNGSTELVRMVAIAYFSSDDLVLIPHPTYGEYETACHLAEARVLKQPTYMKTNFELDVAETLDLIQKHHPKGIFLCNPNNPTGQYLTRQEVEKIILTAQDSLVILDEAYIAFTQGAWSSLDLVNCGNIVILRSMTKDYALAGLRLGYTIAAEPIISVLKRVKPPWNVTATAQKAGIVALNADGYLEESKARILEAKTFLMMELESLGLSPVPSQTNFFLVKAGNAAEFRQALLKKKILVRDCTSFGLSDCIRVAPRTLPECQNLISAIKDIVGVHSRVS
jgi:histidinol-phosphate aminotransferase